jgi:hypothetical protein
MTPDATAAPAGRLGARFPRLWTSTPTAGAARDGLVFRTSGTWPREKTLYCYPVPAEAWPADPQVVRIGRDHQLHPSSVLDSSATVVQGVACCRSAGRDVPCDAGREVTGSIPVPPTENLQVESLIANVVIKPECDVDVPGGRR